MKLIDSLTHQPVALAFGTSGLRGLVKDMTDLECYINTAGFLRFMADHEQLKAGEAVYIAGDLRHSTPRIMQVIAAAVSDCGYQAVNAGLIPTPALAYHAFTREAPCAMVTGSHIPSDRNGIKFYKRTGEVLKTDEADVRKAVAGVREELYAADAAASPFDASGALKNLPDLPPPTPEADTSYRRRYLDVLASDALAGLQVVVYQQSAVARDLLVDVLRALKASITPVGRSDVFIPIDTENITPEDRKHFRELMRQHPEADALISADGDSDRPIIVDETGEFHRGDVVGLLAAEMMAARSVAIPVSCNDAVDDYCSSHGITLTKTKIGSPYVIAAMEAAQVHPTVGWEVNGGFLLNDDTPMGSGSLRALPTRDALLPILCVLLAKQQTKQPLSALFARLPARYTGSGIIDNVPEKLIAAFRAQASDKATMRQLVAKLFQDDTTNKVESIDLTDGLRVRFASGDVVHFRPSGNAPQFRVYTNAGSQDRANELVAKSLAKGGYLEQLLTYFA